MANTTLANNALYTRTTVTSDHKMLNCWEPGVTKFTASNFYNFEQDNLPLYDLEERTYFNWQQLGFTSDLPPNIHLLVSADAPAELVNCNSNIYTTIQDAINALPRYIEVPTRVTVASFGNLGSVDIDGINVAPKAVLEIINVNNYDRAGIYGGDASSASLGRYAIDNTSGTYYYDAIASSLATEENAATHNLYKSFISSGTASLGDNSYGCGGLANFFLRPDYGVTLGQNPFILGYTPQVFNFTNVNQVFSSLTYIPAQTALDSRVANNYYGFMTPIPGVGQVGNTSSEISRLSAGSITFSNPESLENGYLKYRLEGEFTLLEESSNTIIKEDIGLYDPSSFTKRAAQGQLINTEDTSVVKTVVYGNYIERLKISNIEGRLVLRNFFCSGSYVGSTGSIGIQVDNCNNVILESVAVTNFNKMGICLTNSKVNFGRSLYVYRCYGRNQTSILGYLADRQYDNKRLSKPWSENIKSLDAPVSDDSAGIVAFNSEIFFESSDEYFYYTLSLRGYSYSFLSNLLPFTESLFRPGTHNCKIISRCSTGIKLVNSVMHGGQGKFYTQHSTANSVDLQDYLHIEGNANYGIDAHNSTVRLGLNLQVFQNTRGVRAKNSSITLDSFKIDNNHLYGLNLDNTTFTYGGVTQIASTPSLFDYSNNSLFDSTNTKKYQFMFVSNGQHILAKNSVIKPGANRYPIQGYFGRMIMRDAHAAGNADPLPANELINTKAELLHLSCYRDGVDNKPLVGAHFSIKDNSEVTFLGTANSLTNFTGPFTYAKSEKYVGLAADTNSTYRFRGPTAIYDGAVNVLATNNSNIIFEPHKKLDGTLNVETYDLTNDRNHTMVEVKAIRSCLVADKNSNIIMEDLGSFTETWNGQETDSAYSYPNAEYTSAGFFQFYPNPNGNANTYTGDLATVLQTKGTLRTLSESGGKYYWGFDYTTTAVEDLSSVTNGGVCLRALNNSNVRVRNVNFPCGWWNASSVIYDLNDPLGICGKTFIWNFANNSTLHADHLSVSSAYPSTVGYHGPSALWFSAAGAAAYGAPSSTPDTSTLSVLDAFGYGLANVWPLPNGELSSYGFATPQNQGPFRLYVGVDSLATQLYQSGKPGYATQAFAQGYNVSGNLSALVEVSGVYGKILRITDSGELAASGYYYANEFVKTDPNLIMLDESAANTFANAKNGAMGTSNRPQICTIYSAYTGITSEGKLPSGDSYGSGFRSPNVFDILEEN